MYHPRGGLRAFNPDWQSQLVPWAAEPPVLLSDLAAGIWVMPQWCLPSTPSRAGRTGWNSADILIYSSAVPWRLIILWLSLLSFRRITCWRRWRRRGAQACPHSFTFYEISFQHLPSALQHHSQHVGSPSPPPTHSSGIPLLYPCVKGQGRVHTLPPYRENTITYLFVWHILQLRGKPRKCLLDALYFI